MERNRGIVGVTDCAVNVNFSVFQGKFYFGNVHRNIVLLMVKNLNCQINSLSELPDFGEIEAKSLFYPEMSLQQSV